MPDLPTNKFSLSGFFNNPLKGELFVLLGWDCVLQIIQPEFSQEKANHPRNDEDGARQGEIEQIVTGVYLIHQNPHGGSNRLTRGMVLRHAPGRRDVY